MDRTTTRTTRRAILGGAILAIGGAAIAAPAKQETGVSPKLLRLIDAANETDRRSAEYHAAVYEPVRAKWLSAVKALPVTTADYANISGGRTVLSNRDRFAAESADRLAAIFDRNSEAGRAARTVKAATAWRDRAAARLREHYGIDAIVRRANELGDEAVTALDAVASFPSQTIAELARKIDCMEPRGWLDDEDARVAIIADIRRLAGREA